MPDSLPDDFFRGLNFLGKPVSTQLFGESPGTPGALAAGGAPSPAPSATPAPAAAPGGQAPSATPGTGANQTLNALLQALGIGKKGLDLATPSPSQAGITAATAETPGGAVVGSPGEEAAGLSGIAGEEGLGGAASGTAPATGASGLAEPGLAGILAQEAGVGVNVGLRAQGKTPAAEQANLAAIEALMATTGAGALAIPLTEMTLSGQFGKPGSPIDYATSGAVSLWSDLYGGGRYAPTRKAAFTGVTEGLKDFGNALTSAARSGDPADALKSLQVTGPVRATANLPPEVAKTLGLTSAEFSAMKPEQFTKLLDWYAEDPARIAATVGGSGDVPYLPGRQAKQVADQAASGAQQLLTLLVNRRRMEQQATAPAPAAPPTPTAAPSPGLSFPPIGSGQVAPFLSGERPEGP